MLLLPQSAACYCCDSYLPLVLSVVFYIVIILLLSCLNLQSLTSCCCYSFVYILTIVAFSAEGGGKTVGIRRRVSAAASGGLIAVSEQDVVGVVAFYSVTPLMPFPHRYVWGRIVVHSPSS